MSICREVTILYRKYLSQGPLCTVDTLSGFQDFFLQAIIKDWPNTQLHRKYTHFWIADKSTGQPKCSLLRVLPYKMFLDEHRYSHITHSLSWTKSLTFLSGLAISGRITQKGFTNSKNRTEKSNRNYDG